MIWRKLITGCWKKNYFEKKNTSLAFKRTKNNQNELPYLLLSKCSFILVLRTMTNSVQWIMSALFYHGNTSIGFSRQGVFIYLDSKKILLHPLFFLFICRSEYRQAMMKNMSSTLVETVSIDYEDFNESFLTCGTCLCK